MVMRPFTVPVGEAFVVVSAWLVTSSLSKWVVSPTNMNVCVLTHSAGAAPLTGAVVVGGELRAGVRVVLARVQTLLTAPAVRMPPQYRFVESSVNGVVIVQAQS